MNAVFQRFVGMCLCLAIFGCVPFRYNHPISVINESKDTVQFQEGRNVHPDTVRWLLSIGALRYGLSIDEIQRLLILNQNNYCGIILRIVPVERISYPELFKLSAHGMAFSGQYYAIEEWRGDNKAFIMFIAFEQNKSVFAVIEPTQKPDDRIVLYLVGDQAGINALINLAQGQSRGTQIDKDSLSRWLPLEAKLLAYLHQEHTKNEITAFCKETFKEGNPDQWILKESSYNSDNVFLEHDFLACFKKDFMPLTTLTLYVDEASYYYCNLFTKHPSNPNFTESDIVFECYFDKEDILIGVSMWINLLKSPLHEGMLFQTLRNGEFNQKGEPIVTLWGFDISIEDKQSRQIYATFPKTVMFWKPPQRSYN